MDLKAARTVFLVEDNVDDENLTLRAISRSPVECETIVARDGEEAVRMVQGSELPEIDLVLLDLKLPKLNCIEVLREIRAHPKLQRVPVVCFTSSSERSDMIDCFENGANSFVRKAIEYDAYMDRMSKLVEYWLSIHEPCVP